MKSPEEKFRDVMSKAGLDFAGPIIADAKLHRFKAGEDREPNSWYVLQDGTPVAGAFGCWRRQLKATWCEGSDRKHSPSERKAIQEKWKRSNTERKAEETRARDRARRVVCKILREASKAESSHPYLSRKGIRAYEGLLQWRSSLVVPILNMEGDVESLQFIDANGSKRFLRGGQVAGCVALVGVESTDSPIVICEGYATGATIHEATGHIVVCALNCGNLLTVAKACRKQWPTREIIVAADNDQFTKGNPGLSKATDAASAIGAKLAVPQFKDIASKPTDFNDLQNLEGTETVKRQIGSSTQTNESDTECFARLAKLSPSDYDRCRESEAKRLGIRVVTLDEQVNHLRAASIGDDSRTGDLEPWDSPVDGAELLDLIASTFERFCVLPPHAARVLAVWCLQTYCYRVFEFAAVIAVWSPEPSCGKGRVLDVTEAIVMNPFRTANTSAAVLYHQVSKGDLTVLIDELDSQGEVQVAAISNILKSGFQSNGKAHRMAEVNGVQTVVEFATYSPKMVAAIGLDSLDKATRSRAISIRMTRKPRDSSLEKFRRFDGAEIRRKCIRWIQDNEQNVKTVGPLDVNECTTDRQEDVWEPLVAIGRVAGGDWEARIRVAAQNLSGASVATASDGIGHQLLLAIKTYFDSTRAAKVGTKALVGALNESGDFADCNRGRGVTPSFLARMLGQYGVTPRVLRDGDGTLRGYDLHDFREAFSAYLPDSEVSNRNNETRPVNIEDSHVFEDVTEEQRYVSKNVIPPNKDAGCYVVTAQIPKTAGEKVKTPCETLMEEAL